MFFSSGIVQKKIQRFERSFCSKSEEIQTGQISISLQESDVSVGNSSGAASESRVRIRPAFRLCWNFQLVKSFSRRANTTSEDDEEASDCSQSNSMHDYGQPNGDIDFVDVPSSATLSESNNRTRAPTSDIFAVKEVEHSRRLQSPTTPSSDVLDKFLLGLGATIRTFPEMEVAKMKLELSTIVFNKELELAGNRTKKNDCSTARCECCCHTADSK